MSELELFNKRTVDDNSHIEIFDEEIGEKLVKAVDARQLWIKLENKRQFGNWIKDGIDKYGYVENEDYLTFNGTVKRIRLK